MESRDECFRGGSGTNTLSSLLTWTNERGRCERKQREESARNFRIKGELGICLKTTNFPSFSKSPNSTRKRGGGGALLMRQVGKKGKSFEELGFLVIWNSL